MDSLLIPIVFISVILPAQCYFKFSKIPSDNDDAFSYCLDDSPDCEAKPVSLIRRARARCKNALSTRYRAAFKLRLRSKGLRKACLVVPGNARSFCHGMGAFLNKNVDPGYVGNIGVMLRSLAEYMDDAEAQEHAGKCTTEETHRCALEWTMRGDVELFAGVSELTHNALVRTLMGDDFYESSDELLGLLHAMERDVDSIWSSVLPDWVPSPPSLRLRRARDRVKEIFWEKLTERHIAAKNGELDTELPDYITYMLHDPSTGPLSRYLASHLTLLMFASHTSTAAVISWVVVCLLRHPDVMAAVKRDARSAAGESVLLQACIKETIRYYDAMQYFRSWPPAADAEDSTCFSLPYTKHDLPENHHPHSDTWMPGRWLNAENKLVDLEEKVEEDPEGAAGRGCPGEKMAAILVTQTLTTLLRCYDIKWATPDQPHTTPLDDLDFEKTGSPWLKGGLRVKVSRRVWPELMGGC
ncbi:Lanosterol 14-alpha demethylase [Colletotrichum tanaceti]|uniref:Lanosterol 14-alpha demethylase n=1 Tax=Colletotrichum tanaceti TaxID=1306861 RepID=A0A4U6X419_9PEZI|nr:Lanosterol 14-alpha demethylase [Colletotrichum tanaceti]TKW50112.1 Lanosterol 14-alpha demethylase [Colletotrichum tanaceti]